MAVALLVGLAACRGDADDAPPPPAAEPVTPVAADSATPADSSAGADSAQAGLVVVVERRGASYVMFGRTDARALELSVEDGHNVLYGPAELEVRGGAFRTELTLNPTDRETVFAYLAEPSGARQWVVPIPLASDRVTWGAGAAELTEPEP